MRVLVAMSGGVDSSVAAALLVAAGHEVVGATLKLWGGASDSGCCSVADVEDARRVARLLGVEHHVFNFSDVFESRVVAPYAEGHAAGRTPNPCIECNRHLKFDVFLQRALRLGFDSIATGHHARVVAAGGGKRVARGVDRAKDQSYVLSMLGQAQLCRLLLPVGEMTKAEVRARASAAGLPTAAKPDSQDVCFIAAEGGGRRGFLGSRVPLRPGRLVDSDTGAELGVVDAVELVTVGQRKGMGNGGGDARRYAVDVDVNAATVTVGPLERLLTHRVSVGPATWSDVPLAAGEEVEVQTSAHGNPVPGRWEEDHVLFADRQRRVAPGQTVALYHGDLVAGSALAL
ncbi:MAG TPA: tRNA 2-thiouridine(34) synthase MnmA [Acidimicrobiales bacterium]|nr:tRNA 2-thiouridine(34) synthase MnmA [Acidimicrobiales bacterium]